MAFAARAGARASAPSAPGTIATPAPSASFRASRLSPMARICPAVGPMNTSPAPSTASANAAFSARKPKPGCTASAPEARAAWKMASAFRQLARASAGPMRIASSHTRVWSAPRSASERTATERMPISRSVAAMRHAISPRLAIRTFWNMGLRSLGPPGLPLLEERRETVFGLVPAPNARQRLRERAAVVLPAALGPADEQLLDARLRLRAALEELAPALVHAGVQLRQGHGVVHDAHRQRPRRVEALAGEHQLARRAVAEPADHVRADESWHDPQAHLGEAELRVVARHRDVARAAEPHAAAVDAAVHAAHHRLREVGERREHLPQA